MAEATIGPKTPDIDRRVYDKVVIKSANAEVGVNDEGGYITSWKVKNPQSGALEDVLYVGSEIKRTGIPTLFPNYGEGGQIPTHGFGRNSQWRLEQDGTNKVVMKLSNGDISEEARAVYPHQFGAAIAVEVGEDGSLNYSLDVENRGEGNLPITPGLHPYWAIPQEDKRKISTQGIEGFNASEVDWDANPPDTVYDFNGKAVVILPEKQITIEDITPTGPVVKSIVAWSQTPEKPDYNFVCFEPITGGDNAINSDPILIPPKGNWNMSLKFTAQHPEPSPTPKPH